MAYIAHLSRDRKLKKLIDGKKPISLDKKENLHYLLCASILSQQLSTRVASVILKRFLTLFGGEPTPMQLLGVPPETLRSIGLSNAKVRYVQNVARFAIEEGLDFRTLDKMENEALINYLTRIKGVGRWTAEMLLMFSLGREDVFAADDLGIQNAMARLYKLDPADKKKFREDMLRIAARWSPYRTYACLHLWDWKDNAPLKENSKKTGRKKSSGKRQK
jgi:DNA-3-methyladenine glycosylase II